MGKLTRLGVTAAALATLSACGGSDETTSPTSSVRTVDSTYRSIEEIGELLSAQQIECDPIVTPEAKFAAESGRCPYVGSELIISVYSTQAQLQDYLKFNIEFASMLNDPEPSYLAVGGNWTIGCGDNDTMRLCSEQMVERLGGRVWSPATDG